jgi:formate dehydrogenase (NADP+) alpha subunit
VAGLATTFGSGAMTNNIEDFGNSKCILAVGTNTAEAHPVLAMKIRRTVRTNGAKLIVINPMEVDFVRDADLWLRPRYGTDVALLMGLCRIILDEGLEDEGFIAERCEGFDEFKAELEHYPPERVAEITGVEPDLLMQAARMYAQNSPSTILYAMGLCEHSHGTENVMAAANLSMITGNVGAPGAGVNPLRGQNNVQGACDMGALPDVYPGYQKVDNEAARAKFEATWGVELNPYFGLKLTEMMPAARDGLIRCLYIMGENPVLTDPDGHHIMEALESLDFFVFQDLFLNETAQFADVVLPACSFAEKEGTFTNTERRVQRVRKAVEPVGDSRPDWWIVSEIARRMGARGFDFGCSAEIMDEIARLTPSYGGISHQRLEDGSLQWPCPSEDHAGTCIMHEEVFARPGGKGKFVPLKYRPPVQTTDADYPLMLMTGRRLYHYHATMTRKVDALNDLLSEELAQINPEDAAPLGVASGDMVRVASAQGEVDVRARVTEAVPPGMVAMAFHFAECPTNRLISSRADTLDPITKTPAYKTCPVSIAKVEASGPGALVAALHRAMQDPEFRAQLAEGSDAALAEYRLSDADRIAVAEMDLQKIEALLTETAGTEPGAGGRAPAGEEFVAGRLDERLRQWLLAEAAGRGAQPAPR